MTAQFISFNFHYTLSRKIPFTNLGENLRNVKFAIENGSIIGFDITIQRPMGLSEAQHESDTYAYVLSDLISIKSQKYTIPSLSGFEADDANGDRHIRGGLKLMWDIEGAPANLSNINQISELLSSNKQNIKAHISYLAKAIALEYQHFPDYSLIELFKVIERDSSFPLYYKYFALRNILAHSPTYYLNTVKYFLDYFDENSFDYLEYDLNSNLIILNLHSDKTLNELYNLVRELRKEVISFLKIH